MSSQTSLVAKSCRLQQWAVEINECQNRPKTMTVDEWCDQHAITKATYYYRLKCVRQAYLPKCIFHDSVETSVIEFVEMPVPNKAGSSRGDSCVAAVRHINQSFSIDLFDTASTTFIKNLLGAINHAQ